MSIWFRPTTLEQVQATFAGVRDINLHLDIRLTEIGDDFLRGSIPVDERTRQPFGLLHGGASVVLAETLGRKSAQITSVRRARGGSPEPPGRCTWGAGRRSGTSSCGTTLGA
jgi:acyl-coenzyme A thioesterase PaaI-like protein